jgi:biotin-dependent carboxylase-like uncharacterized protein
MIRVADGGFSTTVQDGGRFGMYHIGMPPSGALDDYSFRVANLLVGNDESAAVLETTYTGPALQFEHDAVVAVTGAQMTPLLDGEEHPLWEAFPVGASQTLSFGILRGGARCYIAVAGGIDVPDVLGSKSTYTLTGLGGYEGRKLAAGDELSLGPARPGSERRAGRAVDERLRPTLSPSTELRTIPGLCSYRVEPDSMREFLEAEWVVAPAADRVGYRYRGIELEFVEREPPFGAGSDPSNVVDVGYPIGSIQVPGGVEPIVLLNDAVTGGGYATIGTVISPDRDRLAQTRTHGKTRFDPVTLEQALQVRADRRRRLDRLREELAA